MSALEVTEPAAETSAAPAEPKPRRHPTAAEEAARARKDAAFQRRRAERLFAEYEADQKIVGKRFQAIVALRGARALEFYAWALEHGVYEWGPEHRGKPSPYKVPTAEPAPVNMPT